MSTVLYLEDLYPGRRFTAGPHLMTEERIVAFAQEFDPQPFHLSDEGARGTVFGSLAASGWHTAAVAIKMMVESDLKLAGGLIGFGGELTWPKPVRPGDVLRLDAEVLEVRESRSKPRQGVATVRSTLFNQASEAVYIFTAKCLVYRR